MEVCRLQCDMEACRISFEVRWKFNNGREYTALWLEVDESEWGFQSFNVAVVYTLDFYRYRCFNRDSPQALVKVMGLGSSDIV